MSGPNHLWSGNWEDESERAAEQRAVRAPIEFDEPAPPDEPEASPKRARRLSVRYAAAAGVLVIVVAVALAVTLSGSSTPKHPKRIASTATSAPPTTTQPGPTGGAPLQSAPVVSNGPTANWLGMQLVTVTGGVAISSLQLNSAADKAGFEPGDVIEKIDGHAVSSVSGIAAVTAKLPLGHPVQIQVLRSSVFVMMSAVPMKERPTIHP
ncbi:MAG TPA: PDZ domain-containing protein [Solirubrobacteraceae bacterium]|jgi:membrane-associated protease RseP (regulator of RpoE activity)|nr:PDZ domain-containing protein [Solirubrobacteraceae bacterium]